MTLLVRWSISNHSNKWVPLTLGVEPPTSAFISFRFHLFGAATRVIPPSIDNPRVWLDISTSDSHLLKFPPNYNHKIITIILNKVSSPSGWNPPRWWGGGVWKGWSHSSQSSPVVSCRLLTKEMKPLPHGWQWVLSFYTHINIFRAEKNHPLIPHHPPH